VKCEEPPTIPHAKVIYGSNRYFDRQTYLDLFFTVGMKVQYLCMNGYQLIGESTVVCKETGFWSALPECVQKAGNDPFLPHLS
jgi:hypothetical protein